MIVYKQYNNFGINIPKITNNNINVEQIRNKIILYFIPKLLYRVYINTLWKKKVYINTFTVPILLARQTKTFPPNQRIFQNIFWSLLQYGFPNFLYHLR